MRALIDGPLNAAYRNASQLGDLSARFRNDGYVKLPDLLSCATTEILRREIAALEPLARKRDFVMAGPDTPRVMSVLGATQLLSCSAALAILYVHFELVRLISQVADAAVHCCRHPEELMVCNFLLYGGSTHGWHLDDPAYALVVVLEAPEPDSGGELEYVSDWHNVCRRLDRDPRGPVQPAISHASTQGLVRSAHHRAGDTYLLRADRCLHRVAPLASPKGRRVALNFAYERTTTAAHGHSATVLYGSVA